MQALDELVARWRKNPDPESTLALCAHLGTSRQSELLREVGNTAEAWHRDNHSVMLSVGRMYLDAGLLAEAQAAFVQVGKLTPAETEPYRYLGEVLLRRGDAVRSEKALARAIKFGDADPKTRLWHERSVVYSALQQRKGLRAVAEEVARTAPQKASTPAPTLSPFESAPSGETRSARRSRPPLTPARPSRPLRSSPPAASRRRPSVPPSAPLPGSSKTEPLETLLMGRSLAPVPQIAAPVHPPSPFFPSDSHSPGPKPRPHAAGNGVTPPKPNDAPRAQPRTLAHTRQAPAPRPLPTKQTNGSTHPPDSTGIPSDPFRGTFGDEAVVTVPNLPSTPALMFPADPAPLTEPVSPPPTSRGTGPELPNGWLRAGQDPSDGLNPSPETILLALAQVGLYESDSGVVPAWEATRRATPRRTWWMAGAVLLTVGMGFGGYRYAVQVQGERLTRAQELSTRLAGLLDSGSRADLRASEADFQQLFELDSRGQEPAMLWLKNRVLYTLLDSDPVSGIESAMQRARTVGVEEQRLVFGRLASALAAGDLPGAGQIISEWDGRAKGDAMYQLLAGAVFERAGNPEALERFASATQLQPDLKLAHLMAARLALLQLGPAQAKAQLELAYGRLGPGPATQVLRGLEWAASPVSDPPIAPPAAAESLDDLPPLLHTTASAVQAVRDQREGRLEEAAEAFKRALGPTTAPAMAAWIGYQALDSGEIEIARAAALKSMQLSALHKNAQALAARVALSDGRLQAAQDAVRGLDPSSRDAVLIEAVSAYENLQGSNVEQLVSGLPADPSGVRGLLALHESANVIRGQSRAKGELLERWTTEQQVWGALIAIDVALDQGQLELAEGLIQARGWDGQVAAHGARLLRLRRYQGQLGAALELVAPLLEANETTPRVSAEVILSFVDAGRVAAAASSLGQVGAAAGALAPWLEALVEAARGRQPSAVQLLKSLALPSKADPLLVQVVALRALALSNDRRAKGYYAQLAKRFPTQPDVQAAGKQLGVVR